MPADASRLRVSLRTWAPRVMQATGVETGNIAARDGQTPRGTEPHPGKKIVDAFEPGNVSQSGTSSTVTLRNTAPQSLYTDRGTRPHGPVRARVLRFTIGGQTLYRPRVRGIGPQRWWRPVIERSFRQALPNAARRVPF